MFYFVSVLLYLLLGDFLLDIYYFNIYFMFLLLSSQVLVELCIMVCGMDRYVLLLLSVPSLFRERTKTL